MKMISDLDELKTWSNASSSDLGMPFELVAYQSFPILIAASYSVLFDESTVRAFCNWSRNHLNEQVAAFFVEEDAHAFFMDAGYYGGLVFTGRDDPSEVHHALFEDQNGSPVLSVYEASNRMFVVPKSGTWMSIGERSADIALLCFSSEEDRIAFFAGEENISTFESLADGARHAVSFMRYPWSSEVVNFAR